VFLEGKLNEREAEIQAIKEKFKAEQIEKESLIVKLSDCRKELEYAQKRLNEIEVKAQRMAEQSKSPSPTQADKKLKVEPVESPKLEIPKSSRSIKLDSTRAVSFDKIRALSSNKSIENKLPSLQVKPSKDGIQDGKQKVVQTHGRLLRRTLRNNTLSNQQQEQKSWDHSANQTLDEDELDSEMRSAAARILEHLERDDIR